jgi:hypothetical protein
MVPFQALIRDIRVDKQASHTARETPTRSPQKTTHLTIQHMAQPLSPIVAAQSYLTS